MLHLKQFESHFPNPWEHESPGPVTTTLSVRAHPALLLLLLLRSSAGLS